MEWFTSDTHFWHKKILSMGVGRPQFKSIEDMEQRIIENWNRKVKPEDTVYILGDFCWGGNVKRIKGLLDSLNGKKTLVIGNHDRLDNYYKTSSFVDIVQYKEIRIGDDWICMNHFPIAEWDGYYYGSYHLYGHTHGTFNLAEETLKRKRPNGNCWDVGVDNNNFEPVNFEEIKEKIKKNIEHIQNG